MSIEEQRHQEVMSELQNIALLQSQLVDTLESQVTVLRSFIEDLVPGFNDRF